MSALQEELTTLSNVRNLVSQLYEALNVEEHQLKKEREILAKLEDLKVQLAPMEKVNVVLIGHSTIYVIQYHPI